MGVLSNNYAQIVPGALISASYVSDLYDVLMGSESENVKISGSIALTGSLIATTGVTASLMGTASWAISASSAVSALTASYAISASYINYINSSSQADTATTASYALTASYVENALTASYILNAVSASYSDTSLTASYVVYNPSTPANWVVVPNNVNDALDTLSSVSIQNITDDGNGVVTVNTTFPLQPVIEFNGVSVDSTTITGSGISSDPLACIYQAPAVDGVTITGDGTLGNPLVAVGGGGAVNYANVIWVDSTNGSDGTGAVNDFAKPMLTINGALSLAATLSPSFTSRALIYLRKGYYVVNTQFSPTTFIDYADFYSEPGVIIAGGYGRISDQFSPAPVNVNFMGYADMLNCDFYIVKASTINIQVNSITNDTPAFLVLPGSDTANVTIEANKIYSQGLGTAYGSTIRNSSNVTVNIKEQYRCPYSLFDIRNHSGRIVVNAPNLTLTDGNINGYGGNYKQVVIIRANLGGEMIINGDLVNEEILSYVGSNAGIISRVQDSWGTLRINGSIYSGNMFGVNAQGSSAASRTIINGNVRTNNLVCYVASNSSLVFRNGTLMNWNTTTGSASYPVMSVGGNGNIWVENCHIHSLGSASSTVSAFWKDTTTSNINVYNTVYSAADTSGSFIRNSAGGQPVNNVRILNCRSTKPLDTNITDLLTPTGFIQDANIQSINFI